MSFQKYTRRYFSTRSKKQDFRIIRLIMFERSAGKKYLEKSDDKGKES